MTCVVVLFNDQTDTSSFENRPPESVKEWDDPAAVDLIVRELRSAGYEAFSRPVVGRESVVDLVAELTSGEDHVVFNMCEMSSPFVREALIPSLFELLEVPYTFGRPDSMVLTLDKYATECLLRPFGVPVPDSVLINDELDIPSQLPWNRATVKPRAEGSGIGVVHVEADDQMAVVENLLRRFPAGLLLQETYEGAELTVSILEIEGEPVVLDVLVGQVGSPMESFVRESMRREVECHAKRAFRVLRCHDAARIDFIVDAASAEAVLVDVNAIPLLDPRRSYFVQSGRSAGFRTSDLFAAIVDSACWRWGQDRPLSR